MPAQGAGGQVPRRHRAAWQGADLVSHLDAVDRVAAVADEVEQVLVSLRSRRELAVAEVKGIDLETGAVAKALVDRRIMSKSQVAQVMGVSHTYVAALIARLKVNGTVTPGGGTAPPGSSVRSWAAVRSPSADSLPTSTSPPPHTSG
jgi:hypothetical protein